MSIIVSLTNFQNVVFIVLTDFSFLFSPKDDTLGELMSTVCGCTCEGEQVWVHARRRGVGDGPTRLAGGSESMRVVQVRTPSKPVNSTNGRFYWLTRDVALFLDGLCPPGRVSQ